MKNKGSAIADDPSPEACHWVMRTGTQFRDGTKLPASRGHEYVTKFKYTEEQVNRWECAYPIRRA